MQIDRSGNRRKQSPPRFIDHYFGACNNAFMITVKYAKYKPHGAYLRLSNETFIVDADDQSGVLKGIYLKDDPYGTNYVGNEQNMRVNVWWKQRYVPEKSQRIPMRGWTGDIVLKAREVVESGNGNDGSGSGGDANPWQPMHSFLSDDIRHLEYSENSIAVAYQGQSENQGGFRDLKIKQSFELHGDQMAWNINLENDSQHAIEIGELGLPLAFNTNYGIGDEKQGFNHRSVDSSKEVFEQRVIAHHFVSGNSTYVYANRPNGIGPFLLVTAASEDTSFEAIAGDYYQGELVKTEYMTAMGPIFYLYSGSAAKKPWFNGHRTLNLAPGEERRFSLKFRWIDGHDELEDAIYQSGNVAIKAVPGYVLPKEADGKLLLRCKKPIHSVDAGEGIDVSAAGILGDRYAYDVKINETGEQKVTVKYGNGEWTNILFYGIESIEKLVKARARFIAEKQQVLDPEDPCYYGFRTWDNEADTLITPDTSPCGIIDLGGGDDRCNAPPMYLAEKNVYYPDPNEIKAMDDFVEKFLYGKLQIKDTFEVRNCLYSSHETYEKLKGTKGFDSIKGFLITDENGRETTWRTWDTVARYYNYPYAYNIYYNMYRIAKRHGAKVSRPAKEYLYFAYKTALTAYADSTYERVSIIKNYMDYHGGNMTKTHGAMTSWNVMNILSTLKEQGMDEEYGKLNTAIEESWPFFLEEDYPFPTEYCFDMPSFAPVYYIGKAAGSEKVMTDTVNVILACRHNSPLWFFYGSDLKSAGNYTTPQGARPLLDSFEKSGNEYHLRIGYGATLLIWSCVDPSGKGFHTREWRFNAPEKGSPSYNYYWNEWMNGELGMGLYANFYALKSYLVFDADFGPVGYGCVVDEDTDSYTIEPWDGLGVRASFVPLGVEIETVKGRMKHVEVQKSRDAVLIKLDRPYENADEAQILIRGLQPGGYMITGLKQDVQTDEDGALQFEVDLEKTATTVEMNLVTRA